MNKKSTHPASWFKFSLVMKMIVLNLCITITQAHAGGHIEKINGLVKKENFSNFKNPARKQVKITGVVTDEKGNPLSGVSVTLKGTQLGIITNSAGAFTLTVPSNTGTLQFSFVGYETQNVEINSHTVMNIKLLQTAGSKLADVVIIGYGSQKRSHVTAAISSVPMKEIVNQPVSNVATALQGKIPGVLVQQTSGSPGAAPAIKIRGFGSISAGNSPLIVVDGNIVSQEVFQTLGISDIESIDVLKDASSAAIYGSKGSNGVILVTTKHGKNGTPQIKFNFYIGDQQVAKKLDILNSQQFAAYSKEAANNGYLENILGANVNDPNSTRAGPLTYRYPRGGDISGFNFDDPQAVANLHTYNFQDMIFRTAPIHNYELNVSGGSDKIKYNVSTGYLKQDGIIITSNLSRYNLRANVDIQANSKLKIGININPSYRIQHIVNSDGHWASNGIISAALATPPMQPIYDANGKYTSVASFAALYSWAVTNNAVADATEQKKQTEYINLLSNVYAEYLFLDNLKYRVSGNANLQSSRTDAYNTSSLPVGGLLPPSAATASAASDQTASWLVNQTLNYTKSFAGVHNFDVLLGMEATRFQYRNSSETGNGFPNDVVQTLNAAGLPGTISSGIVENASNSIFARISYNYSSRYLLNFSIRRDGSSIFSPKKRYGTFPAASIGWNIGEESFARKMTWLSNAKVRASYGISGNNAFNNNYPYISSLAPSNYAFGNSLITGVAPSTLGNTDLGWEKNQQLDLGVDISVFKNRISLTIDYYNRITKDLLLAVAVPTLTGYGSSVKNIGSMRNRGMEFSINTNNIVGSFIWSTNANLSFNRNIVLALGPTGAPIISGTGVGETNITEVGQPIGNFYGYKQIGIFQNQNDLNTYPHFATSRAGDVKYKDVNSDGILDPFDRTRIGNNQPKFIYAINNSFAYKGFDLGISLQGTYGGQILNLARRFFDSETGSQNQLTIVMGRWKSASEPGNGTTPRFTQTTTGNSSAVSSRWVESGSFLRLQNISFGYTLPAKYLQTLKISKVRFYLSAQNVYTWTKYLNYNPDVSNYEGPLTGGVDYGSYPLAKTFVFGLNIIF